MNPAAATPVGRRGGETEPVTVERCLRDAEGRLSAAGLSDPRREAVLFWAAVAGTSPSAVWLERAATAAPALREPFRRAVESRSAGVPAAYATGTAAFRSVELVVDRRVLIPRPETEGLVDRVLAWARERGAWGTAVDVGTGSGCIALSLAVEGRFSRVIGTDLSADALAVARENALRIRPDTPVTFREGDVLWAMGRERVEVIVANPPYVTMDEWSGLDPSVREHEPRLALVSGEDGLRHTEALLRGARTGLLEGGLLALEVDSRRSAETRALARRLGWGNARLEADLFGRPRYLLATRELE